MTDQKRRVVITGLGVVSAAGIGWTAFQRAIGAAIPPVGVSDDAVAFDGYNGRFCDPDAKGLLGGKGLRNLDKSTVLALAATKLAIDSKPGGIGEAVLKEAGVIMGTAFGGLHSIGLFDRESLENPNYVNPMAFPNTVINSPTSQVSVRFGMESLNLTISTGQSAGADAIGYGMDRIRSGQETLVFAGGVEELSEELFYACQKTGLLRKAEEDKTLGVLLGEGAGVLVLESLASAQKNGSPLLAEAAGYGTACDAGAGKDGAGAQKAMLSALSDAGLIPEQVDAVVVCQNGLRRYDAMEASALKSVFGERLADIALLSVKRATGETMGAGGALSVAFAALLLSKLKVEQSDEARDCAGQQFVHPDWTVTMDGGLATKQPIDCHVIMIHAFGCNGVHAALVLKKL